MADKSGLSTLEGDVDVKTMGSHYQEMLQWLSRIQLSEGIPFPYFVPREELLPQESIRFFHVDRNWIDAMIDGALSVALGGTTDKLSLGEGWYSRIISDLIGMELGHKPNNNISWQAMPITGFLIRSRAVRDWPGMEVSAYSDAFQTRLNTLRQVKLSDNVMLCLFCGIPTHVRIQEPLEGLRLGFDAPSYTENVDGPPEGQPYYVKPSDPNYKIGPPYPHEFNSQTYNPNDEPKLQDGPDSFLVPSRRCSTDNSALYIQGVYKKGFEINAPTDYDSALLAMQLMQFPYQQDFYGLGDVDESTSAGSNTGANSPSSGTGKLPQSKGKDKQSSGGSTPAGKKKKKSWFGFGKK